VGIRNLTTTRLPRKRAAGVIAREIPDAREFTILLTGPRR